MKHNAANSRQIETTELGQKLTKHMLQTPKNLNVKLANKMYKTENCRYGANAANDPRKKTRKFAISSNKISEHPLPNAATQQKNQKSPHLDPGEKVDARAYTIEHPPNRFEKKTFMTECNEEPTQDWRTSLKVGMILRNNIRHPENPKPLPE